MTNSHLKQLKLHFLHPKLKLHGNYIYLFFIVLKTLYLSIIVINL